MYNPQAMSCLLQQATAAKLATEHQAVYNSYCEKTQKKSAPIVFHQQHNVLYLQLNLNEESTTHMPVPLQSCGPFTQLQMPPV